MDKCIVYLPVYNGAKFLKETLDSVLNQDYENYQVVICDDCSSDESPEMISGYIKEYPKKIVYLRNHRNLGVGTTLHNCYIQYHDARFFAQIGHDDVWPKNYLSQQVAKLQSSDAVASFAQNDYVDTQGKPLKFVQIFKPEMIDSLESDEFFLYLVHANFLCAPASMVDLSKVDPDKVARFWGYNNERLQDCELWLNLCLHGTFLYNQSVTIHYRIHGNNLSDEGKRVMQGKLEYYTMLQRVFTSNAFFDFIEVQRDPIGFIDRLLDTISENFGYSNPLKLLIIDMCEHFLNEGYESETIWRYLNWMYMDSGVLTKCLKNGRNLPGKITILHCGIKNGEILTDLDQFPDFCVVENTGRFDPKILCAIQEDDIEYFLNADPYPFYFSNGQMIIFCKNDRITSCQKKYPHLLTVSEDISALQLSKLLYSFVEDKTHIYRNGFFDMSISYHQFEPCAVYHSICIKVEETVVRTVLLPGHTPEDFKVYDGSKELPTIPSDASSAILERYESKSGELYVHSDSEISLREQIVVNNILYVCTEVVTNRENQPIPIFKRLCYCNNNEVLGRLTNFQLESLYANTVCQLQEITHSFSYIAMIKIKKVLHKLRLTQPLKRVMIKIYQLVKGKPYGA